MGDVLQRVMEIVSEHSGVPANRLSSKSAIDQDVKIVGDDVTDLAELLAEEFGDFVWNWPWKRFAMLDEGVSPLAPFSLIWQLLSWPWRGAFEYPSPFERLELGHIAAVIEKGEWFDP
ncbi:MAG: hypothetical protein AB7F98_09610 [Novosphingobium sp.]